MMWSCIHPNCSLGITMTPMGMMSTSLVHKWSRAEGEVGLLCIEERILERHFQCDCSDLVVSPSASICTRIASQQSIHIDVQSHRVHVPPDHDRELPRPSRIMPENFTSPSSFTPQNHNTIMSL